MPNEVEKEEEFVQQEMNIVEMIDDMKKNTVPVEKYNKLLNENRDLVNRIINGSDDEDDDEEEEETLDVKTCRDEFLKTFGDSSNLTIAKNVLKLRKAIIESGGNDPFLPFGRNVRVTDEDVRKAQNVANVFEHCIEYAGDDPAAFTTELMRLTKDTGVPTSRKK